MSTNINITVGDNALLDAAKQQQVASRQAQLNREASARLQTQATAARTAAFAAQGRDANGNLLTGSQFTQPQIDRRPAANRKSGPLVDIGYYKQGLRDTGAPYLQFTKEIFAASGDGLQVINELLNETIPYTSYYPSVTTEEETGDWPDGPQFPKPGTGSRTETTVWEDGASSQTVISFSYGAPAPVTGCYSVSESTVGSGRVKNLSDNSAWYALPIKGGNGFIFVYHRLQVEQWRNFVLTLTATGTQCPDGSQTPVLEESFNEEYEDPIYLADLYAFKITAKNCRKITVPSSLQGRINTFPLFEINNEETDPSAELVSPHAATYNGEGIVQDSFDVQWWGPNYYENSQTLSKPSSVEVKTKNGPFPIDVTNASLNNLQLLVVSDWRVPSFCRASLLTLGFTPEDLTP